MGQRLAYGFYARSKRVTGILEKQNRLQMSQVFPFRASMIKWALLFKDSMSGTEERVKLPDSPAIVNARTDPKLSAARLEELPGPLPLANFRSRMSEAVSPNRCCSHAALLTPRPRRSEARPR